MKFEVNKTTVGMVVTALPKSKDLLKEYGIDFCCGGHRLLDKAIRELNLNPKEIYNKLNELENFYNNAVEENEPKAELLEAADLTVFIENKHHQFLRTALPTTLDLLNTLLRVHGTNHKELFEIYQLFGKLKTELEQHLLKEELMLFPELVNAGDSQKIQSLANEIIMEHEGAGEILKSLRTVTNNFTPPADGCDTYKKAFALLEEIEQDLHEHIHLENNILLKNYDNRQH